MNRPRSYTIAAVLTVLFSLVSLVFELPNLIQGPGEIAPGVEGPPIFLTILNFTLAILGFVAAYGIWQMQKWGVVLGIIAREAQKSWRSCRLSECVDYQECIHDYLNPDR